MESYIAPLFGILGILTGGLLQFFFNTKFEKGRNINVIKHQAYVDYLLALTQSAYATSKQDIKSSKELGANAKARIAVYGDSSVISAIAKFESVGANLMDYNNDQVFIGIVEKMREDKTVTSEDLKVILLGF